MGTRSTQSPPVRQAGSRKRSAADADRPESDPADPSRVRVAVAHGAHGRLKFTLHRVGGGLYVEREEVPVRGTRTCISLEFRYRGDFRRWYENDPARFDHPLFYQQVGRDADELWESEA